MSILSQPRHARLGNVLRQLSSRRNFEAGLSALWPTTLGVPYQSVASAQVLAELGVQPVTPAVAPPPPPRHLPVQMDGRLVGTGAL